MQLNLGARNLDPRSGASLEFIDRLVVERLRISHLRLCGFNAGTGFDYPEIGVARHQRHHVEDVLVTELRRLLDASRRAKALDRWHVE